MMACKYLQDFDGSDIVFKIDNDVKIYANKTCLSLCSPVFKLMFSADFKEKDSKEIHLPGKNADTFLCLMKLVHPPSIFDEIKPEYVRSLIDLAEEYQILGIKQRCEQLLLNEPKNIADYEFCLKYNLKNLKKKILKDIINEPAKSLKDNYNLHNLFPGGNEQELIETLLDKSIRYENKLDNFLDTLDCFVKSYNNSISQYSLNSNEGIFTFSAFFMDILTSDDCFTSPKFELYNNSWFVSTRIKAGFLGIYLNITTENYFTAKYRITILSHKANEEIFGTTDIIKSFNTPVKSWGYPEFIKISDLLELGNGFLKEGLIVFNIHLHRAD